MKQRESNLELLRIVSMFLIVMHHFAIHGCEPWANHFHQGIIDTENIYLILLSLGKAAVVAFVLIGAYFLSEKKFKLWRVVNLCLTTFIYSWLIYLILFFCFPSALKIETIPNVWLPIPIPSNYWFVIAYVYMLLMMPFLNLILDKCSQRQVIIIICGLILFWCILQFVPNSKLDNVDYDFFSTNNYFLLIYLIGGYIRRYGKLKSFTKSCFLLLITLLITELVVFIILNYYSKFYDYLWWISATNNGPFGMLIGVPLFLVFKNMHIGYIRFINYVSRSMFGVYLIHDNSFLRDILWKKIINTAPLADNPGDILAMAY